MSTIISVERLGAGPMPTDSPFLFAVHHLDTYPAGDAKMAPAASLKGHNMGADFGHADGWSIYHGETVPGFPKHPHRGFETVTIARRVVKRPLADAPEKAAKRASPSRR